MNTFDQQVATAREWFAGPRFAGIFRLYSPREVAEQQAMIFGDYSVPRRAAEEFYARLMISLDSSRPSERDHRRAGNRPRSPNSFCTGK